jgi:pimeloyl-ACP methyl ester carboxylesterase
MRPRVEAPSLVASGEGYATTADGIRIHFRVAGAGKPPLVFVHGWCSNLTHWDAQTTHFARHHHVLAVDRRGHGLSDVPERGYTARRHAADLAAVARTARISGAVVVGHAGGGPTTLEFARSFPELANAVVLIDTHVSPRAALGDGAHGPRTGLGALIDQLDGEHGAAAFEALYRGYFSAHAGPAAGQVVADAMKVPLSVARAELASMAISTQASARALTQPVLWITVSSADEHRLSTIFRNVQFGRVVGSGHFPHVEVPDQVNAMIERFIATLE